MSSNVFHKDGVGSTGVDGGVARVRTSSPHRSKQGKGSPKMGQQAFKTTSIYTHRRVPSTPRLLKSKLHLDVCVCTATDFLPFTTGQRAHHMAGKICITSHYKRLLSAPPHFLINVNSWPRFHEHFNLNTNITQPMKCFLFLPNVQRGP